MDIQTTQDIAKSYVNDFKQDGVVVFKRIINAENIQALTNEISTLRNIVMTKINTMDRPLKTYSDIAERHLGRLDYRCGFTAEIFNDIAAPIINIIQHLSPNIDFRHYWGAIPALGESGPTDMHRDVYPFLNTTEGVNLDDLEIRFPPYYFTVLIPLVDITAENGPTQFIKGSHLKKIVNDNKAEIYAPLLSRGDIVIFDGRTLHKGSANKTQDERLIAYITFIASWYNDQTFVLNDYLFPELSTKGK